MTWVITAAGSIHVICPNWGIEDIILCLIHKYHRESFSFFPFATRKCSSLLFTHQCVIWSSSVSQIVDIKIKWRCNHTVYSPCKLLTLLCQSNFLSRRCSSWLQMVNQWEHVWFSSFSTSVCVLWAWLCDLRSKWISLSSSEVISFSLDALHCSVLSFLPCAAECGHIQFCSHLPPFSTLPLPLPFTATCSLW